MTVLILLRLWRPCTRLVDNVLAQGTQYAALRRSLLRELPNLKGRAPVCL